jgi:hypothetical protein
MQTEVAAAAAAAAQMRRADAAAPLVTAGSQPTLSLMMDEESKTRRYV